MMLLRAFLCLLIAIIWAQKLAAAVSPEQMRALGIEAYRAAEYTPKPEYPVEARVGHFTGAGIFVIVVHVNTGRVAEVHVARSTGHAILDQAAVRAFRQWRFKPGGLKHIGEIAPWRNNPVAKRLGKGDVILKIPCDFTLRA
jgi:TonB family protein